jgi:ELWxxDGT repeat protein
MRTNFTIKFLLCVLMPVIVIAQSKQKAQKPFVFHQSQIEKYPGGMYAAWDSACKQYKWHSPQNNYLNKSYQSNSTIIKNEDKESIAVASIFHLVKDINTATDGGGYNGQPQFYNQHYAVLNGIAYFGADDGIHGAELWRSDGTDAGTYMVKDIEPGAGSGGVSNITAANGKIFFSATTSANGPQPWISDGTDAGTRILKDISAYANGGYR